MTSKIRVPLESEMTMRTPACIVPCRSFIRFVLGMAPVEQLLSSCNDVNYPDVDCHYDGNPDNLSDPRQHQEPTEEQDEQKYAELYLRAL